SCLLFSCITSSSSSFISSLSLHDALPICPPPLRLRPTDRKVILRAADPQDRASAVAASGDLTGRRLASRARKIADQRYEDRQKKRQAEQESVGMDELETRAIMSTTAQPRGTEQ